MEKPFRDILGHMSRQERMRFLSFLVLYMSVSARSVYPGPDLQETAGYREFQAFNEMYHEIGNQLVACLDPAETRYNNNLEAILYEKARFAECEKELGLAISRALNDSTGGLQAQ